MTLQNTKRLLTKAALIVAVLVITGNVAALGVGANGKTSQGPSRLKGVNLGLYWDSVCANATVAVAWGTLSPGSTSNVTVYVRNEGNLAVKLNLAAQNWNPASASNYITLAWNREGQVLKPQKVAKATLTLSVSSNVSGITSFSFDTIVTGTGQ